MAYNPAQPRDKRNGRWTNAGSSWGSADPATRTAPTATVAIRHKSLDRMEDNAAVQGIARWYEMDLGDGYTTKINENRGWGIDGVRTSKTGDGYGDTTHNTVKVQGVFVKDGEEVGAFNRTIRYDPPTNTITVEHAYLSLQPKHQGQGIAHKFNQQVFNEYRKAGVDRIVLDAADEVGGYAWARQGYRVREAPGESRSDVIGKLATRTVAALDTAVADGYITLAQRDAAARDVRVIDSASRNGRDVQPADIARLGEQTMTWRQPIDGTEMTVWPGKVGLIGGAWPAVFYFDAGLTASGVELNEALQRHLVSA